MLVLETLENARARGAKIYAELAGFGMSADAYHLTSPLAEGAARAMNAALEDGHLSREQINYVNAHGTGTQANDSTETRAIRQVFGSHVDKLAVSSTKSMHGHALGAAGALEGVATLLAFRSISCRRRRISSNAIRPVISMLSRIKRAPGKSKRRFRILSPSAD
jgi:nodulation protein E